ncbi:hypothetical protein [Streptomyces sp. IMTB 1903]|uniref:hypothetical protein n=1 Tax=Streptomyces sp. IMTB 1903 TaxID=1776680 RepID=UPI0007521975|nr:hypothetical protein [Streptomyces sp. IMTB 1903]
MTYIPHDPDHIPVLAPDHHHSVDWDRVRATIRRLRPLRAITVLSAGFFPAVVWCNKVAEPLAAGRGTDTAFAAAFLTSMISAVGMATGGTVRRFAFGVLLFSAVGGTLLADPTRRLIAGWVIG